MGHLQWDHSAATLFQIEDALNKTLTIQFEGLTFDEGFRVDLLVCDTVIVELKSTETVHPVHKKQTLTYLKLANKRLGLLINFGSDLMKDGITRIVNGLPG